MKTPTGSLRYLSPAATLAAAFIALANSSEAQNLTWIGGNATGVISWGGANNFSGAYANGANLTFTTANSSITPIVNSALGANRVVNSITFGPDVDGSIGINLTTSATSGSNTLTMGNATLVNPFITVASGSTGDITIGNPLGTASLTASANMTLGANLTIDHQGSGLLLLNRPLGGSAFNLTKTGAGTMQTNNNNLVTGSLTITQGKVIANTFGDGLDLRNFSAVNLNGGTLQINQNTDAAANKFYNNQFNVTASSTLIFSNTFATSKTLTLNGTTTLSLGADLKLQNITGNVSLSNSVTLSRNVTGSGNLTVETYNNIASVEGGYSLGQLVLSGNNSAWSGNLVIARGTAVLAGNSTLGSGVSVNAGTGTIVLGETDNSFGAGLTLGASGTGVQNIVNNIVVRNGGYRGIRGSSDHSYTLNGTITLEGDLNLHNGLFFTDKNITVNGNVSGPGGLNITESGNPGFIRLRGDNTYSGATTIGTNATLSILSSSGNGIGDTSAVNLAGSGSALTIESNETIGSLASSGTFGNLVLTANLTTGGNNQSTTYGGISSGSGGITKTGTGTFTLSGNNSYTGATTVSQGTLIVTGSISSSSVTTVAPGALLTFSGSSSAGNISIGSGAIFALGTAGTAGAVTINGGTFTGAGTVGSLAFTGSSVFSPGNSPGTVTIADGGSLTMSSSTISNFEITSSAFTAGTYDSVIGTPGGAAESVVFDGILNLIFSGSGYSVSATAVKLFDVNNYSGSFSAINVTGLDTGLVATFNSGTGYVEIAAIPEPSSIAVLAGFGALGFVAYRRRRQMVKAA